MDRERLEIMRCLDFIGLESVRGRTLVYHNETIKNSDFETLTIKKIFDAGWAGLHLDRQSDLFRPGYRQLIHLTVEGADLILQEECWLIFRNGVRVAGPANLRDVKAFYNRKLKSTKSIEKELKFIKIVGTRQGNLNFVKVKNEFFVSFEHNLLKSAWARN